LRLVIRAVQPVSFNDETQRCVSTPRPLPLKTPKSFVLATLLVLAGCHDDTTSVPPTPAVNLSPLPALAPSEAVVYEVFVADFSQAGTFAGMLPRLDSIKSVGGNVLWLMPVFPTHSSPYAVDNYEGINPEFGNLAAFDQLVAAAHQRGLRVMLDWVANHTSMYHPWLQSHPDWYTRDASGQVAHPLPTWTDVADLDYAQPALRQEMIRSMKTWVTGHAIDGFRCDAADLVPFDFWQQALTALKQANPNLLLLAEGSRTDHHAAGFQLSFGWDFYNATLNVFAHQASVGTLAAAHRQEMQGLPAGNFRLRFLTNHDEVQGGTPATRLGGEAAARAAYVATLAFGATPLLYNGQEAGDPAQLAAPSRTPIRWGLNATASSFYRGLFRAYQQLPALRAGSVEDLSPNADVLLVRRQLAGQQVAVLVNVRNAPIPVLMPAVLQGVAWIDALTGLPVPATTTLVLPAYGYAIWQH
jgi:glycosidase